MSIARKVTLYVMLFSGLFTVLSTGLQLYMDYRNDLKDIETTLNLIDRSHIDSLVNGIWNLDKAVISTELTEIMNLPDIVYLELNEFRATPIKKGALGAPEQMIMREYDFSNRGAEREVAGSLKVAMTTAHILQRLRDKVFVILIAQSVKTLGVALFIIFLFHMLVTRHIEKIRAFISETSTKSPAVPLKLDKGRGPFKRRSEVDEFGILVSEINTMRQNLSVEIEANRVFNEKLQREIVVRHEAENALIHLRNYLSKIINSMPSVIVGVDLDGKVTQWNKGAEEATGVSENDALGQLLDQSFSRLSQDMRLVFEAIKSGQRRIVAGRLYMKDEEVLYEDITVYPLMDDEGKDVEGAVVRLDDVTEKHTTEVALRRAQKMEAIGELTGGVAHDFNNILGVVMGNLELLKIGLPGHDEALVHIDNALKGASRGADLTGRLLGFSRHQNKETKRTNVNKVIEGISDMIARSLTASVSFEAHYWDGLWPVDIAAGDLEDTILNLSLNAKDAMPDGGTLIVKTTNKVLDDSEIRHNPNATSRSFIVISVSDSGTGMTAEVRDKALEPFFTTKEEGKGTGLGLSMVYGFVQRSGGHIQVDSELGKGTTFHIFLPRLEDSAQTDFRTENVLAEIPRGTETILVVDDEESLLDVAAAYLSNLGYSVLKASDASKALEVMDEHSSIDLLFSDIIMAGGMDGYQLAEIVRSKYPKCAILLTSGYIKKREALTGSRAEFVVRLGENRLPKPYNQSTLAFAIRRALDEAD